MRAREQVTGPGGDALCIQRIVAVDLSVKLRKRIGILRCRAAQDQAIAQIPQNGLLFCEHLLSCGRFPTVMPAQDNRRY